MKSNFILVAFTVLLIVGGLFGATEKMTRTEAASFGKNKELLLPANYQSWVALSPSTVGMPSSQPHALLSKVYVEPTAYDRFLKAGSWPDHTVIVLELRDSAKRAKTPCDGVIGLEVAAKNNSQAPDPWSYYGIIYDQHKHRSDDAAKETCQDCDEQPMDMRLAMYFPALRAVIHGTPLTMQPSAF